MLADSRKSFFFPIPSQFVNYHLQCPILPSSPLSSPTHIVMPFFRTLTNTLALGGATTLAGWTYWTRSSRFIPFPPNDPIFQSAAYLRNNPLKNPATQDICVRKVPLAKIKPQLLEKEGKLVEAFCAGVWGGLGRTHELEMRELELTEGTD